MLAACNSLLHSRAALQHFLCAKVMPRVGQMSQILASLLISTSCSTPVAAETA